MSEKTNTKHLLSTLEVQLKLHDWFFEYSDDQRYWEAGHKEREEIWETIEKLKLKGENELDQAMKLYKEFKPVIPSPEG
ncbi:MAG: hypothetical protein NZ811_08820 [Gammaproteobacteria bacterium]|nr:hypothetical protein [Gammaproteobacteria bacterium]